MEIDDTDHTNGIAPSFTDLIIVCLDLKKACDIAGATPDQRRLISLLFIQDDLSAAEATAILGFSTHRAERVTRGLRADRAVGAGLRRILGVYKKNNLPGPVRDSDDAAT